VLQCGYIVPRIEIKMRDMKNITNVQGDDSPLFSDEPMFVIRRQAAKPEVKAPVDYSLERARLEAQRTIATYRRTDLQHGDGTVGSLSLNSSREGGPLVDALGKKSIGKPDGAPIAPGSSSNLPQLSKPASLTPIKRPEL
jgi:hypothetical protein